MVQGVDSQPEPEPEPELEPDGTELPRSVRMAADLQQLVAALMEGEPRPTTAKALKKAVESVAGELGFEVEPKDLKLKALAKIMGKKKSNVKVDRAPDSAADATLPSTGAHGSAVAGAGAGAGTLVRQMSAAEQRAVATARNQTAAARVQREADSAELARVSSDLMALKPVPLVPSLSSLMTQKSLETPQC